jgi:uncharacterized damage-inducible protein DinB
MSFLTVIRVQLVRELEGFVREVEACPDDESLWQVAPGVTNSVGTLALHVCGNLQDFVGRVLGGSSYVRNREHEFSHRGSSRADVVAELRRASAAVSEALAGLDQSRLDQDYPMPLAGNTVNTAAFLAHLGAHIAFHLGQAGYLRRIVTGSNTSTSPLPIAALVR